MVRSRGGEFDFAVVALDGNDAPQQFERENRCVILAKAIAACNQARFRGSAFNDGRLAIHNPMDNESSFPQKHHDLSRRNFPQAGALDGNQITWKDGRNHAGAGDAQADFAEFADDFLCQSTRRLD